MAVLVFEADPMNCPKVLLQFKCHINVQVAANKLQKYTFGQRINKGGFGEVFQACDKQTKHEYAIKIIDIMQYIEQMSINQDRAEKIIENEIALQMKVQHPNVITVEEHFKCDNKYFIVMELAENNNLREFLKSQKQPLETLALLNIVIQICKAVEATHACGIIHRDLKPENFVFCKDGLLKLTDFGLARECKYANSMHGTLLYMSPEIHKGEKYTYSTDIFSLGCILFELMELRHPFGTVANIITNVIEQFTRDYPQPLQQICLLMLDSDSRKRPTIDKIKKEIEELSVNISGLGSISETLNHVEYQYEIKQQQISNSENNNIGKEVIEQSNTIVQKFNQIIDDANKWKLSLSFFIDDQVSAMSQNMKYQHIDLSIFKEISNAIIQNHVHKQKDENFILSVQSEIILLKDNFSTLKTEDGIFYGEINTKKVEEFRKHVRQDGSFSIGAFVGGELTGFCQLIKSYFDLYLKEQYNGEYRNNVKCGIGKYLITYNNSTQQFITESQNEYAQQFVDENEYIGEWKNDKRNGPGNQKMLNMNCVGLWNQDYMIGFGQVIMNNGQVYEGIWKNDKFQTQIKYKNGDMYQGNTKIPKSYPKYDNIILCGTGKMMFQNGDVYEGEWDDNLRSGKGAQTYKNGSNYTGKWFWNKRDGYGSMQFENGDKYEGMWEHDKMDGFGKMLKQNGEVLEGIWRNDKYVGMQIATDIPGHGRIVWKDEIEFEGSWNNEHYQTHFQLENGDTYAGDVDITRDGVTFSGRGKMIYQNGDVYEGQWFMNKRHGQGSMQFKDGDKYEGMWKDDLMDGFGKMQKQNGEVLEGIWRKNEIVGKWISTDIPGHGKIILNDGIEFEGRWDNERFMAHFQLENGDAYSGEVDFTRDGVIFSGRGKMQYQNGDKYEGWWKDNQRSGKGTHQYAYGDIYTGNWQNDIMHGQGKLTKQNGEILEGLWECGQFIGPNKSKEQVEQGEDEREGNITLKYKQ